MTTQYDEYTDDQLNTLMDYLYDEMKRIENELTIRAMSDAHVDDKIYWEGA